ncbi:hypothetical protein [Croceicoccus sp. BE223]|uniref:hypothetical protein n=1 Tax=Croceicoccus sp. BE223 TaxID=2817716 RepID=UPI00285E1A03|nr:hypothetical protein [Croceicoccus sp. BE223]MDR7103525.1 hypothetical protein [Croceicoccus sp. BE223]
MIRPRPAAAFAAAFAAIASLALAPPPVLAGEAPRPVDVRAVAAIDCTLRLTSDTMTDVPMMQDTAHDAAACRAACERYAAAELVPLREAMTVLRYTCLLRDEVVAEVDLKA